MEQKITNIGKKTLNQQGGDLTLFDIKIPDLWPKAVPSLFSLLLLILETFREKKPLHYPLLSVFPKADYRIMTSFSISSNSGGIPIEKLAGN